MEIERRLKIITTKEEDDVLRDMKNLLTEIQGSTDRKEEVYAIAEIIENWLNELNKYIE